jgi:adenylate cyclase
MGVRRVQRRLAAIVTADVVGYSRLMSEDETGTLANLKRCREAIIAPTITEHGGRTLKLMGDGMLVEFGSAVDALECAVAIQRGMATRNADVERNRRIFLRIGINVGDVIVEDDDLYGDGVNVAARLETLASAGGICISGTVHDQVAGKIAQTPVYMGKQALKNIEKPVRAYRIQADDAVVVAEESGGASVEALTLDFLPPERPSVAIVPFKSMGADPEQAYLADGIRLGIQSTLVQLSGLFLVNAPAMNAYRGQDVTPGLVGSELDVRYVLEGAVQKAGNRVRATVQLTDVAAKATIWAERYDRLLDDVFDLQDEISREVVSSLSVRLFSSDIDPTSFGKLSGSEAREYFCRGISHLYKGTPEDNVVARETFEKLFRVEPRSVLGPSNVSVTHWVDAFFGWSDNTKESIERATEWAERALEYAENNGLGHTVLGHLQLLERRYEEALAISAKGVQLRPNCPMAHGLLGSVLNYYGDPQGAVKSLRNALGLSRVYPVWLINLLAAAYRDSGQVDLSIPAAKEAARLDPDDNEARLILCSDYAMTANLEEARTTAEKILAREPSFGISAYARKHPYKNHASLDRVVEALREAGLPD